MRMTEAWQQARRQQSRGHTVHWNIARPAILPHLLVRAGAVKQAR